MAQRVRVDGADEAIRTLDRIEADASKPPPEAGRALAEGIWLEAPMRTGFLRSTIQPQDDASVVVSAPYAVYVDAHVAFTARGALRARGAVVEAWERHVGAVIAREGAG